MAVILFWTLLFLTFYCYIGYPAFLFFLSQILSRKIQKQHAEKSISIILAVHNEEDVIENKIKNILSLNYPPQKVEIIIGSDGSDDSTNEIIRQYLKQGVSFFPFSQRRGKMATLNDLVAHTKNDILVFTDARQEFENNALEELIANFSDNSIGCVSGELIFRKRKGESSTAQGINFYWNYEKMMRSRESSIHSMLGATGAIYAIRRELYTPVPRDVVLDDMFVPLNIIRKGYRAIFDDSAKAYDYAADSPREEYRRKARTLFGNYQIFTIFWDLFIPFKSPIALQLFSHKLLRVIVPFFMIAIFLLNFLLAISSSFYEFIFRLQIIFYLMACLGALSRYSKYGILKAISRICYIPYVFCLLNFSALAGFIRFTGGRQQIIWKKARGQ
jgi:cellulose synthase/poly-beta-1,6-N-acetylglucosamine synthase-like glycosyltransferase